MTPELAVRLLGEALRRAQPLSAAEQDALSTVADLVLRPMEHELDLDPLTEAATAALDASTLVRVRVEELRDQLGEPPSPTLMQRVRGWFS